MQQEAPSGGTAWATIKRFSRRLLEQVVLLAFVAVLVYAVEAVSRGDIVEWIGGVRKVEHDALKVEVETLKERLDKHNWQHQRRQQ